VFETATHGLTGKNSPRFDLKIGCSLTSQWVAGKNSPTIFYYDKKILKSNFMIGHDYDVQE